MPPPVAAERDVPAEPASDTSPEHPAVASAGINISSLEGKCGKPGVSIYVTSKHAVNGFTNGAFEKLFA